MKVTTILRLRPYQGQLDQPLERVIITRNRTEEGLGLALPAGKVALFGRRGDRRILLGEGRIDDYAVGEKVEIPVTTVAGVRARQIVVPKEEGGGYKLTLTNDMSRDQAAEIELPLETKPGNRRLIERDGWKVWRVSIPANGKAEMTYSL